MYSKATSEQEPKSEHFLNLHTNIFKSFFRVYEEIIDWLSREIQLHKKDTQFLRMDILTKANTALVIITCIVKCMTELFYVIFRFQEEKNIFQRN
jgi:hypothetical protein